MCLRSRGRVKFHHRRKHLPPPPAEFWSSRQPDLVHASRKSGGGPAEGSSSLSLSGHITDFHSYDLHARKENESQNVGGSRHPLNDAPAAGSVVPAQCLQPHLISDVGLRLE